MKKTILKVIILAFFILLHKDTVYALSLIHISYHLYTMDCQYNLDGGQVKALNISNTDSPYDMMFLCVNDMWYYCYEKQDEITGKLWRIPIQSGELRQEKKEAVIDTEQNGSFTVAGNNYVEVTKGNRIRVYDMVRKKYSDYKVPKEIAYTKKTEWKNRTWDVLAQGNDWIVWEGENCFFAQDIACLLYTSRCV